MKKNRLRGLYCPFTIHFVVDEDDGRIYTAFTQETLSFPVSRSYLEKSLETGFYVNGYCVSKPGYDYLDEFLKEFPEIKDFWINISVWEDRPPGGHIIDWEWDPMHPDEDSYPIYADEEGNDLAPYIKRGLRGLTEIASIDLSTVQTGRIPCDLYE